MPTKGLPAVYVPARGPARARVLIVGEAPGKTEVFGKPPRPLIGYSGQSLFHTLSRFGHIEESDCRITNTFKLPLEKPENRITDEEWAVARSTLRMEITQCQPTVILALGMVAIHALLPETRGMDVETINATPHPYYINSPQGETVVIPSVHPAAIARNSSMLWYLIEACKMTGNVLRGRYTPEPFLPAITEITDLPSQLNGQSTIAVDTEALANGSTYIVSVSSVEGQAAMAYCDDQRGMDRIRYKLSRPTVTTLLHNALYDLDKLALVGVYPANFIDTMHVAFLLDHLPLGLKPLSYRLLHRIMRTYTEVVGDHADLSTVDVESREQYAALDPDTTLQIFNLLWPLRYPRMEETLTIDQGIMPMVIRMMNRGWKADRAVFEALDLEFATTNDSRCTKIERMARELGFTEPIKSGRMKGHTFNPRSSKQIAALLYDTLQLHTGTKIKKNAISGSLSTSKKMTSKLREGHPIVKVIDEYKEMATLRSSFSTKLPRHIAEDGRIHTQILMTRIPHSGRFATKDPNLLAIPVRSTNGHRLREGFIASEGFTIVSVDLSQIELRWLAHNSQDPTMLKVFNNNGDIHAATAQGIFGIPPEKQDDYLHRLPSKTVNFGICNLIGAQGLSRELITASEIVKPGSGKVWTEARAQELIDMWFSVYPGAKRELDRIGRFAMANGYITDAFGRKLAIPQAYSHDEKVREEGIRIACNQNIQSPAQRTIKQIMFDIWAERGMEWAEQDIAYPLLQIHDDIIHEVRDEYVDEVTAFILHKVRTSVKLSVPIKAGAKTGKVWASITKWKGE